MTVHKLPQASATPTEPPSYLGKRGANYWRTVMEAVELEPHDLELLLAACQMLDRAEQARNAIRRHGMTFKDFRGTPRPRPEVEIERQSLAAFRALQRELCLSDAPPDSRPVLLRGYR